MLAYLIDGVDMEYRTLGRSGLRISHLSLGAMTFGAGSGIWGEIAGLDRARAARLVAVAAEQGINLIDTADAYSQGKSEEVVGQVLSDLGLDEARMCTGQGRTRSGLAARTSCGRWNAASSGSRAITSTCSSYTTVTHWCQSRKRCRALDDLVTQGKVRHYGMHALDQRGKQPGPCAHFAAARRRASGP